MRDPYPGWRAYSEQHTAEEYSNTMRIIQSPPQQAKESKYLRGAAPESRPNWFAAHFLA